MILIWSPKVFRIFFNIDIYANHKAAAKTYKFILAILLLEGTNLLIEYIWEAFYSFRIWGAKLLEWSVLNAP